MMENDVYNMSISIMNDNNINARRRDVEMYCCKLLILYVRYNITGK